MSEVLMLYLFTRLDAVGVFAVIVAHISFGALALLSGVGFVEKNDEAKRIARVYALPVFCVSAMLAVLVPSSKDLALIVGGKLAIDAARSEKGRELSSAVYDAVMAKLREAAKEKK